MSGPLDVCGLNLIVMVYIAKVELGFREGQFGQFFTHGYGPADLAQTSGHFSTSSAFPQGFAARSIFGQGVVSQSAGWQNSHPRPTFAPVFLSALLNLKER